MTEPVWVPARPQALPWPHPPPGRSCGGCPLSTRLPARDPQLGRKSLQRPSSALSPLPRARAQMSPSGRLYLLTIVGLILPTRGQTFEETTFTSPADPTTVNIQILTPTPEAVGPELQSTPETSTLKPDVEATGTQTESQTQQPEGVVVFPTTDPGMDESLVEVTTLSKQSPNKGSREDPPLEPTDSNEDNPFFYDEDTLRKHGLVVAAVLFITGIIILTSGKCRQLPRLCRNSNRTYRVVHKAQPEREDTGRSQSQSQPDA